MILYATEENKVEPLNMHSYIQVFVHIEGSTVICKEVDLHKPIESLKRTLAEHQWKKGTLYNSKNKKLNVKMSFYAHGLENESNIYVKFAKGLAGGASGYNPHDPSFPVQGDYEPDQIPMFQQYYQVPATGIYQNSMYPGSGYQQGSMVQMPADQYFQNQVYYNETLQNQHMYTQQPNVQQYVMAPTTRGSEIGQVNYMQRIPTHLSGSQLQPRFSTSTSPRSPSPKTNYQEQDSLNASSSLMKFPNQKQNTLLRSSNVSDQQKISLTSSTHFENSNSSYEQPTAMSALSSIAPKSPNKIVTAPPLSLYVSATKLQKQSTSINQNKDNIEDLNESTAEVTKPFVAESDKQKEIDEDTDTHTQNIDIKKGDEMEESTHFITSYSSAQVMDANVSDYSNSNQNIKKGEISDVDILQGSTTAAPNDESYGHEGYGHVTISKSSKKLDNMQIKESKIMSSSSKVFNPGLGSRDDVYSENFNSNPAAFASNISEAATSLTGKPVIQASDKESSVTDEMNFEFKSLTTGDFMLTLKCRQFQELPPEVLRDQRCKHTTKVNISSNRLKEIPKYLDIEHFPSMKMLDASKNKLVELPQHIAEFRGMENLDISHNQCRIFPEVVTKLKQLKILKVNNNSIEYIPNGLGFYEELEILRLEGNKMGKIPEDIKKLVNLQYLNISDNRLDEFPKVICELKKLQFLYMSSNKIKEVPHYLYMNECLEVVQVDKNPIVKPPPDVLAKPIQEIRRYCKEIDAGRFKDDRIVILIQGSLNSGKSSVCSALCSDVTQRAVKPTEGIEERAAIIRDINVTLREFSGDSHYRRLTEIFVVQKALYIVTVDLHKFNKNLENAIWFDVNVSHYLMKVGDHQTVFIVGTHGDKVENAYDLLSNLLKMAEKNINNESHHLHLVKGFVNKTIDSFDVLKDDVTRCLLDRNLFAERGQYRPVKWKEAEPALTAYKKVNQPNNAQQKTALWIPMKTVNDVLAKNEIITSEEIKQFLRYLRCVGSILWHEGLHLLKTFICVNPGMLIKAIKIILSKDHKDAFIKAYKPRWRLNPVPEDDVTYVIACQMYSSRGCINMESIRRILKAVIEDKEDVNMVVAAMAHFDVCKEVNICTPDIKILEIQEGLDAGTTLQEEKWPQLATEVLQANSKFDDDELPRDVLLIVAKNLGKDWLELVMKLGFSKTEVNDISTQFPSKLEDGILHMLQTWKRSRSKEMQTGVKKELQTGVKKELMDNLQAINRKDLKEKIDKFDHHEILAKDLNILLPSWKKFKKEKIYFFPAFLKNGEAQMKNYWQCVVKKLDILERECISLDADYIYTLDEVFLRYFERIAEETLTHQVWKNGILSEGIDVVDTGVLYYFKFQITGKKIIIEVDFASNKVISKYCKEKICSIFK